MLHRTLRATMRGAALFFMCYAAPAQGATTAQQLDQAKAVSAHYARMVHANYLAALTTAQALQQAIGTFLAQPTEANLKLAREAWIAARRPYLQTEAYRYYDGPIDFENKATGQSGPEARLNAWPLNEAYIDYVRGSPQSGIISDTTIPITMQLLKDSNQQKDEEDVTTGYHAIEFLLWGQDFNESGPGTRTANDYVRGDTVRERRREYLKLVTDLLVEDLQTLVAAWETDTKHITYGAQFTLDEPHKSIGKMLTGIASLAGSEMAGERINNALMSGEHKDAQSCFSGTTNQDFLFNAKGLSNVYLGEYDSVKGPGLTALVAAASPSLDNDIRAQLATLEKQIAALPDFEATLKTPQGSQQRAQAKAVVNTLNTLAQLFVKAGTQIGVKAEIVPAG